MKNLLLTLLLVFVSTGYSDSIFVSGLIVDTWTQDESPVYVIGDISVASLVIEPGVKVIFLGNYAFTVDGIITAVGTEEDSIYFTCPDSISGWGGIRFTDTQPGSQFSYCVVERSTYRGFTIVNSALTLTRSRISNNEITGGVDNRGGGIYIADIPMTIENCKITNNYVQAGGTSNWYYTRGGGVYSNSSLTMKNCEVNNNSIRSDGGWNAGGWTGGAGIYADGPLTLSNCISSGNSAVSKDGGIYGLGEISLGGGVYTAQDANITNCVISENSLSAGNSKYGGGVYVRSASANIINSTIASNTHHGLYASAGGDGSAILKNTIVFFNEGEEVAGNQVSATYSCIQDSFVGIGNISYNPVFRPDYMFISSGSPCIDSGDSSIVYNDQCFNGLFSLGTERADMGAHGGPGACNWEIDTVIVGIDLLSDPGSIAEGYRLAQNYPNPFNPTTVISYTIPKTEYVVIKIYNSLGQEIKTFLQQNQTTGSYQIIWDGRNDLGNKVSSGTYFYRISAGSFSETRKMALVR